ncbi:MAG: hypothetical protein S0880_35465 [Actinomycetota bacterium]|nr:hypothetical protein [Actinomycetota bacterium]
MEETKPHIGERVLELARSVPIGLTAVDADDLRKVDTLLDTAILARRSELEKSHPGEPAAPMTAAVALAAIVADELGRSLAPTPKKRARKLALVTILLAAIGGGVFVFLRRRDRTEEDPA